MISKQHFIVYYNIAISQPVLSRAIKVALIVGSILNLINQGNAITALHLQEIHIVKFFLTYFVPYSVTTYTATALKLEFQIGTKSTIDADLKCRICEEELHVNENQLIQECSHCGIHTKWRLK